MMRFLPPNTAAPAEKKYHEVYKVLLMLFVHFTTFLDVCTMIMENYFLTRRAIVTVDGAASELQSSLPLHVR
jgi:hypothetical protein